MAECHDAAGASCEASYEITKMWQWWAMLLVFLPLPVHIRLMRSWHQLIIWNGAEIRAWWMKHSKWRPFRELGLPQIAIARPPPGHPYLLRGAAQRSGRSTTLDSLRSWIIWLAHANAGKSSSRAAELAGISEDRICEQRERLDCHECDLRPNGHEKGMHMTNAL